MLQRLLLAITLFALTLPVYAQRHSEPQPIPTSPPIAAPKDIPYRGTMTVAVDATDIEHRIFRSHETIPVSAGAMVLLYPRWIPGSHAPSGPLLDVAGIQISANGKPISWRRDAVDVYAYHVDVPKGVQTLEVDLQYLSPTDGPQGAITMTRDMLRLNWHSMVVYPAGYFMRRIAVDASVRLPESWQFGTALEIDSTSGSSTSFKTVSFETLVDSPLIAGKYFKQLDLDPKGRSRVTLNIAADDAQFLEVTPEVVALHRELIHQADLLYGARHYNHYDFLLTLSDRLAGAGIEHQRSSDNGVTPKYFTTWDKSFISRDLLAHEYNHSWNGKYRRPADLWTPNLNVPMRDSLLWVYEGQTQYFGNVLAARAGLLTAQQALDSLAVTAATYDARLGRAWRNLQDTTNDPIIATRRPIPWPSWQRSEDYYSEGLLVENSNKISAVMWDSPAFKAGLTAGYELIAVNGTAFDGDKLKAAVKNSKARTEPLEFLVKQGDSYRTIYIDYHEGARYPCLERLGAEPAMLDSILAPRS